MFGNRLPALVAVHGGEALIASARQMRGWVHNRGGAWTVGSQIVSADDAAGGARDAQAYGCVPARSAAALTWGEHFI